MKHFTSYLFLLTSCLLLLTSCEYKELCYDHNHWTHASVDYDWTRATGAQPKGMTLDIYNVKNPNADIIKYQAPRTKEGTYIFGNMAEGGIRLNPGTYQAVSYNYDTETIRYRGETASTFEANTRVSSVEEGTKLTRGRMPRAVPEEEVILEPDSLWAGATDTIKMASVDSVYVMDIALEPRFAEVDITITNVPNLEYTGQYGAALSGLAESIYMADGTPGEGTATIAFPCTLVGTSTLYAKFRMFGHCPHQDDGITNTHLLTIYFILADGQKWYYTIDVSSQMHDKILNPDHLHIHLNLDGKDIPVPLPIVNGSGFQPTIDEWSGENIDVTM